MRETQKSTSTSDPSTSTSKTTRRSAIATTIGGLALIGVSGVSGTTEAADIARDTDDGPDRLTFADRRFRRQLLRAVWRLHRQKKLNKKQYVRIKAAAWSGMPIAASNEPNARKAVFVQHLRTEVEKRIRADRKAFEHVTEGFFDDLFENFSFDGVVTWIMENWQLILQIMMALLVFLDAAYEAGEPENLK